MIDCPICNVWAEVKETRKRSDGSVYRRYECANLHRFSTKERVELVQHGGDRHSTKFKAGKVSP
jgi:transcriptional regulator NrdR family protein